MTVSELEDEIDFLKKYCELQQMRFTDKMEVDIRSHPEVLNILVPKLLLQPIVENAVIHGIEPSDKRCRLSIKAYQTQTEGEAQQYLIIQISDDGVGFELESGRSGVGMSNVRERLQLAYENAVLKLDAAPGHGNACHHTNSVKGCGAGMKLVIADDESLVRYTLRSMINEMEAPWQIVGESTNGEELMDLLAEHQPNVAIVDIRMPKMNGLEAILLGKAESPLTKWIVLSGYSDFQYAQEALRLGVSQYLLKPVSPADLERALFDTYKDNKELMILHNQQFCNHLSALSNGLLSIQQGDTDGIIQHSGFIGATILFDVPANAKNRESSAPNEFYKQVHHCIHDHLIYGINMALFTLPSGELSAVGAWDPEKNSEGRQQINHFFDRIAELAGQFPVHKAIITLFVTGEAQGFKEMSEMLLQLQQWKGLQTLCADSEDGDIRGLEAGSAEAG